MKNIMKNTYEEAVKKTVEFWTEKSFKTIINQNNGDDSENGGMAFMMMNMVSSNAQKSITDEKIKKFESKLTELLTDCNPYERTLDVDYHPCRLLSEAASYAELDGNCFPCKTFTRIDKDNKAYSSYQYRGKLTEL